MSHTSTLDRPRSSSPAHGLPAPDPHNAERPPLEERRTFDAAEGSRTPSTHIDGSHTNHQEAADSSVGIVTDAADRSSNSTAARRETIPYDPAEGAEYGIPAALVLALIRYRTNVPGADRIDTRAGRFWRASHETIAATIGGMSRDGARRAIDKLIDMGALVADHHPAHYGDRTRSYRVAHHAPKIAVTTHYADSRNASTGPSPAITHNRAMPLRGSAHSHSAESRTLSIEKELEKKGGKKRVTSPPRSASRRAPSPTPPTPNPIHHEPTRPPAAAPRVEAPRPAAFELDLTLDGAEPPTRCPKHQLEIGWGPSCRACADARHTNDAWHEARKVRDKARGRARLDAIANCARCRDDGGLLQHPDDHPTQPGRFYHCSHEPLAVSA